MLTSTLCLQGEGEDHCIELQVPAEPSPGWGQGLLGTGPGHRTEANVWQVGWMPQSPSRQSEAGLKLKERVLGQEVNADDPLQCSRAALDK